MLGKCHGFSSFLLLKSQEDPWDMGKAARAGSHSVSGSDPAPQYAWKEGLFKKWDTGTSWHAHTPA